MATTKQELTEQAVALLDRAREDVQIGSYPDAASAAREAIEIIAQLAQIEDNEEPSDVGGEA
jgi:HEPN domain-containing protein